jgi:hypothetical protein
MDMKYELLAVLAVCVFAFGGLGYLFVTLTVDVNQPAGNPSTTRSVQPQESAPPAGPIVDQDAPVVLGSPSITTNENRDEIVVDFFECLPGSGWLEFGETEVSFVMHGLEGNNCVISYAIGEDEVTCSVPSSIGTQRFAISGDVPNLGTIETYCEAG